MRYVHPALCGLLCSLVVSSSVGASTGGAEPTPLIHTIPPFTAVQISREGFNQPLRKTKIYMSSSGMREETVNGHPYDSVTVIINNDLKKMWLVNLGRRIFTERDIPLELSEELAPVIDESTYRGGLLATEPCFELSNKKRVKTDFEFVLWECRLDDGRLLSNERFDNALNVVTEAEFSSGAYSSLRNITKGGFAHELLMKPQNYKQVSMEYFFLGKDRLPVFEPPATSQP